MFQPEIFDPALATPRFTMDRKSPDSPSIEASHRKNNLFQKTIKIIHTHLALINGI